MCIFGQKFRNVNEYICAQLLLPDIVKYIALLNGDRHAVELTDDNIRRYPDLLFIGYLHLFTQHPELTIPDGYLETKPLPFTGHALMKVKKFLGRFQGWE